MLRDWFFCTSDPSEGRSFCLSFVTVLRQARKEVIHIYTPLFVHCTPGSKNSPGESISSKIRQHGMPPQIQLSSLCLSHILTQSVHWQKSWPHKMFILSVSHTHTNTIKIVLMCEKIPNSVTAWPFTFIWPHKNEATCETDRRGLVWVCVCMTSHLCLLRTFIEGIVELFCFPACRVSVVTEVVCTANGCVWSVFPCSHTCSSFSNL